MPKVPALCQLLFVTGLFSTTACAADAPTPEDVAVLRAALAPQCAEPGPGYVILSTRVVGVGGDDQIPTDWPESKEMTDRLRARAESRASWSGVRVCKKVLVRRDGDIDRLIRGAPDLDKGWKNFYAVYPGARGVLHLSLPAYSSDGHRAVIVFGSGSGSLCGYGEIIELEKKDGVWRRTREQGTWIS